MGLIRAALGAAGGTLADQWKEFFTCDSLDKDILAVKGHKHTSKRSSNTKGSDNVITNGSGIVVADGQCVLIVDQGKIAEVCSEPGEYTYDQSSEPTIFSGNLGESIKKSFQTMGRRFTFGGDEAKDQRVYYFNTKELLDNKFGTPNPIPFRVVDRNINLDIDVGVRCSGVYSYRITDPIIFYTQLCGNMGNEYNREELDAQLKTEFVSALQPAFAKLSDMEMRPSSIPAHAEELAQAMNEALTVKWAESRGLSVVSIAMNPITLPEEDQELIKSAQRAAINRDPNMAAASLVTAQANAMQDAANNSAGAMNGFMGMGMAMNTGGNNAGNLFAMGQQQQAQQAAGQPVQQQAPAAGSWTCSCGETNSGKFCSKCGSPKPEPQAGWTCSCGQVNTGKFCSNCGSKQPEGPASWTCSCGQVNTGKFCSNCGKPMQ